MKTLFIGMIAMALIAGCSRSTAPQGQDSSEAASPPAERSASSGSAQKTSGPVQNLNAEQAAQLVETNSALVVLDVRTPDEYEAGHIAGSTNIDFHASGFEQNLGQLDKGTPYLVHCASGGRSSKVRGMMRKLGFTQIYHLDGGFKAWKEAGNPVEE